MQREPVGGIAAFREEHGETRDHVLIVTAARVARAIPTSKFVHLHPEQVLALRLSRESQRAASFDDRDATRTDGTITHETQQHRSSTQTREVTAACEWRKLTRPRISLPQSQVVPLLGKISKGGSGSELLPRADKNRSAPIRPALCFALRRCAATQHPSLIDIMMVSRFRSRSRCFRSLSNMLSD